MYVLTEEGKNYLENGLPEKNLIELLKKGKTTVQIVRDKIDSFAIAIQWAKKNNWIMTVQGEIEMIKEPESYPVENALKDVSEGASPIAFTFYIPKGYGPAGASQLPNVTETDDPDKIFRAYFDSGKEVW